MWTPCFVFVLLFTTSWILKVTKRQRADFTKGLKFSQCSRWAQCFVRWLMAICSDLVWLHWVTINISFSCSFVLCTAAGFPVLCIMTVFCFCRICGSNHKFYKNKTFFLHNMEQSRVSFIKGGFQEVSVVKSLKRMLVIWWQCDGSTI